MAIEEVGANPEKLAFAVHRQLGQRSGPVPVVAIASALDIVEIRVAPLKSFEGALVMTPGRNVGGVTLNANSFRPRQRFTLAHELGHFLNIWHQPVGGDRFCCRSIDMIAGADPQQLLDRHRRQEAQANAFAAALLMPDYLIRPYTNRPASLETAIAMSDVLEVSKEAALRRYVSAHPTPQAMLIGWRGRLLYSVRHVEFPQLALRAQDQLPSGADRDRLTGAGIMEWLAEPSKQIFYIERRQQRDGYETVLLRLEPHSLDNPDDEAAEDLVERLDRWTERSP